MNRCRFLRASDDGEVHGLAGVAAVAKHLEEAVACVQSVTEHRRGLGWAAVTEHAFVPRHARQNVRFATRVTGALGRRADARPV